MRAFLPLVLVSLVSLCGCTLLDLQGIDNGQEQDASAVARRDGSISDSTVIDHGDAPSSPEGASDQLTGPPDSSAQLDTSSELDSAADDTGSLSDGSPDTTVTLPDGGDDAARDTDGASVPEAGRPDAADAGRPCDPAKPFGAPTIVTGLQSTAADGTFRLLPNELTGYFWSSRPGGPGAENIYVATRPDTKSPFGAPVLVNTVNAAPVQYDPTITSNGLTLAFRSIRAAGVGGSDIFWASRSNAGSDFTNVAVLGSVNSVANDVQPFLMPDGSEIYFASNRTGDYDLYRATGSTGAYNAPRPISELNSAGVRDEEPVASTDDLTLFFSSGRPGGLGSNDIWMATRTFAHATYAAPTNLTQVNTTGLDYPDWLSEDGCRLYMSSDISGATHIYIATRPM